MPARSWLPPMLRSPTCPAGLDLRVTIAVKQLTDALVPMIKMFMGPMTDQMVQGALRANHNGLSPQEMKLTLQFEAEVFQSLCEQIDTSQGDLTIGPDSLQLEHRVVAVQGSPTAALMMAPPAPGLAQYQAVCDRIGGGDDLVRMAGAMDFQRVSTWMGQLINNVLKDPALRIFADDELFDAFDRSLHHYQGALGLVMRCRADGATAITQLVSCDDAAATRTDNLAAMQALGGSTLLKRLAGAIPLSYKISPDFASIPGPTAGSVISVDKVETLMAHSAAGAAAPGSGASLDAGLQPLPQSPPMYCTTFEHWAVSSQSLASLQDLMAPSHAKPLVVQALAAFGPGQDGYLDCDLPGLGAYEAALIAAMAKSRAHPETEPTLPVLKGSGLPPMVVCWSLREGTSQSRLRLPFAAITAFIAQAKQWMTPLMGRRGGGAAAKEF